MGGKCIKIMHSLRFCWNTKVLPKICAEVLKAPKAIENGKFMRMPHTMDHMRIKLGHGPMGKKRDTLSGQCVN